MDIRVLRYFLAVAQEGNITKAAESLNLSQPTLSRQIMDLEREVGATLFLRGKRQVTLTNSGLLFQQRVNEMIALFDKTERDLAAQENELSGIVSVGCVETNASNLLPDFLGDFSACHPLVQFELYSGDGDDIKEKIDKGHIDMGILVEPVEAAKYDYIKLPVEEIWGILVRKDDPLAVKESIAIQDLLSLPLIPPRRQIVIEELASWLGTDASRLRIFASHNLLTNASLLVRRGLGYAICVKGSFEIRKNDDCKFLPFSPLRKTGHVLAWKKNRIFNEVTVAFIEFIKQSLDTD